MWQPGIRIIVSNLDFEGDEVSIYDAIGGTPVVSTTVAVLYDRVTADPVLAPWFDGIDLRKLKAHQREFLTVALGGAEVFNGRSIREAHDGLAITGTAFDALLEPLRQILEDLGVDDDGVAVIVDRVGALKGDVVEADPRAKPGSVATAGSAATTDPAAS